MDIYFVYEMCLSVLFSFYCISSMYCLVYMSPLYFMLYGILSTHKYHFYCTHDPFNRNF